MIIKRHSLLQDKLGQGGFGITYAVLDTRSNEQLQVRSCPKLTSDC